MEPRFRDIEIVGDELEEIDSLYYIEMGYKVHGAALYLDEVEIPEVDLINF
jgi:hypothetical protein